MELYQYGAMLRRRFWVIALVVGVVLLYVCYQYYALSKTPGALKAYQSTIVLKVGLQASAHNSDPFYSDYQNTAEALADELVTGPVLTSHEFTSQVSEQIQADADQIAQRYGENASLGDWKNPAAIAAAISASHARSQVMISVTWSTPEGAWAVANAIGEVGSTQLSTYLDYEVRNTASATSSSQPLVGAKALSAASEPVPVAGSAGHKTTLLLVLLLVALVIGIALASLVEYLDDRIYYREAAVQVLQLPIYGEIPRAPGVSSQARRQRSA